MNDSERYPPPSLVPHPADPGSSSRPSGELDAFKADVRTWIEVDTSIRKLSEALRERREAKRALTRRVLAFMAEHNIEDLTTRSGRLRAQVTYVRTPISQQVIRSRIDHLYSSDADAASHLTQLLLGNRERLERTSLKRVGGGSDV